MEHKQQNTQTEFSVFFDLTQTFDGLENRAFLRNQRIEIDSMSIYVGLLTQKSSQYCWMVVSMKSKSLSLIVLFLFIC